MATATRAATEALFSARARFAGTLRPSVASPMRPSTNGVIAAPVTPARSHSSSASRSTQVEVVGVEFGFHGDRHREQHARRGSAPSGEDAGDFIGRLDPMGNGEAGRAGVERREPVVLPSEHRRSCGLEELQRAGQVEERLRTCRHGDHRVRGNRVEVGRDVTRQLRPSVHPTDAAGGEHRHARSRGDRHRCRHRRRPEVPSLADGDGDIAFCRLAGRAEDPLVFLVGQAQSDDPVEDRGHRRHSPACAHRCDAPIERVTIVG